MLMLVMVFIGVGGKGDIGNNGGRGGDGVHTDELIFRVFLKPPHWLLNFLLIGK